ncbi:MAG: hypothetical protein JNL19_09815 [Burkholderiales bacterium]|nr:hypothetical protein [Burkholderiales bacterium]
MAQDKPVELQIKNKGGLPLPGIVQGIMYVVFSFPLIVIPMTWSEVPKNPKILLFWPLMCIPLAVMYVLRRAFSRFAVTLYQDGSVTVTQPFNSQQMSREQLHTIVTKVANAHVGGSTAPIRAPIPWLYFFDRNDNLLSKVSPSGFDHGDIERMLEAIHRVRPDVRIQHQ